MVADVREGLAWVNRNCGNYGGDVSKVGPGAGACQQHGRVGLRGDPMAVVLLAGVLIMRRSVSLGYSSSHTLARHGSTTCLSLPNRNSEFWGTHIVQTSGKVQTAV